MIGVLLINLGSPNAPTVPAVRGYLKEFLSNPFVVDSQPLIRWFIIHFVIVPFRAPRSAKAYQKIWGDHGSPLIFHTKKLAREVSMKLDRGYAVAAAMSVGDPKIRVALTSFRDLKVSRIIVFPLYPQYAQATTVASVDLVHRALEALKIQIPIKFLPSFYDHTDFIEAFVEKCRGCLDQWKPDHVLFSFHGLPERHIKKMDRTGNCLVNPACCDRLSEETRDCYRAQCFETTRLIVRGLALEKGEYTVTFQSRMGRSPWIGPHTDLTLMDLARQGVKKVAVACPSFVADCLETLEEIGIRGRQLFLKHGGSDLYLVPSLNSDPPWVTAVCHMIHEVGTQEWT